MDTNEEQATVEAFQALIDTGERIEPTDRMLPGTAPIWSARSASTPTVRS